MSTSTDPSPRAVAHSFVLEHPAARPEDAHRHFAAKLAVETDPSDVHLDLERGVPNLVVVDARSAEAYADCHIPGAISLPHRSISAASVAELPRDAVVVTYCWSPACNAASKAALKLSALGFQVKEMIGGLEYWRREGFPVEGRLGADAPLLG